MSRPCETPGCIGIATVGTSDDGWRCDGCRAKDRRTAAERRAYERCGHLERAASWIDTWGTPEGRERWIADNVRYYETATLRQPPWHRQRTPKEARAAAARAYAAVRRGAERTAHAEVRCAKGHPCHAVQRVLGTSMRDHDFVDHLGPVECDRQETCRDYRAAGDLVAAAAGRA